MKRLLLTTVVAFALTTPVLAQQPQQEKVFTLKLTASQVNVIGKALAAVPFGEALPVVQALQNQINKQNVADTEAAEAKAKETKAKEPAPAQKDEKPCTAGMKLLGKC